MFPFRRAKKRIVVRVFVARSPQELTDLRNAGWRVVHVYTVTRMADGAAVVPSIDLIMEREEP